MIRDLRISTVVLRVWSWIVVPCSVICDCFRHGKCWNKTNKLTILNVVSSLSWLCVCLFVYHIQRQWKNSSIFNSIVGVDHGAAKDWKRHRRRQRTLCFDHGSNQGISTTGEQIANNQKTYSVRGTVNEITHYPCDTRQPIDNVDRRCTS